jgi:NADPH2:quinone reductase
VVAVSEFGGVPELLDVAMPTPQADEVLVRLAAAGVNPFDFTIAQGLVRGRAPHTFPLVLGVDGAGIVEQTGGDVSRFRVGQRVYGAFLHPPYGKGTYAEYIAVPERAWVSRAPEGVSLAHAAAAPSAGMSALALIEATGLHAGERVLVVGASGGVGSFAVQLAAGRGAEVIATARPNQVERLRDLGAVACVDYTAASVPDQVTEIAPAGVDVLWDLVSDRDTFAANLQLLKQGGRAASSRYAASTDASAAVQAVNLDLTGTHGSLAC